MHPASSLIRVHRKYAPTAPTTASAAPDPTLPAAPGNWDADAEAFVAVPLGARVVVTEGVGLVVGSDTPLGQCQWSPWGSQVVAETA